MKIRYKNDTNLLLQPLNYRNNSSKTSAVKCMILISRA